MIVKRYNLIGISLLLVSHLADASSLQLQKKDSSFPLSPPVSPETSTTQNCSLIIDGNNRSTGTLLPPHEQKNNVITLTMYFKDDLLKSFQTTTKGCLANCGILAIVLEHAQGMTIKAINTLTPHDISALLEGKTASHRQCITDTLRALKSACRRFPHSP